MLGTVIQNTGVIEATRASPGQGGSITLGTERDGEISVGGRLTADDSIWSQSSPACPSPYSTFDASTAPDGSRRALTNHDITVESGAKIQAAKGQINIDAVGGKVTMNGQIISDRADISAVSMVNVSGDGGVDQKAN